MSDLGKSWTPKARAAIRAVVLLALAASLLFPFLGRPIWFDEAVTIMNFVLDPYPDIYLNYTIPNNHIAFSYMLRVWLDSAGYFLPVCEMAFRLPAALTSLALIGLSFHFWRKRMGFHAAFASVACLAVSMPFAIYGTAIRGYALSMLLVAPGLEAFLRWEEKGGWFRGALFFSLALAGVAAIPSNALAFAIIALLPTPKARRVFESMAENGWKGKEPARFAGVRIQAAGAAIVAFILFYAPLWNALRRALVHNNGWLRPWAACGHLATGFLVSFWPPLLFALMAGLLSRRRRTSPVVLMGALVFLFPCSRFSLGVQHRFQGCFSRCGRYGYIWLGAERDAFSPRADGRAEVFPRFSRRLCLLSWPGDSPSDVRTPGLVWFSLRKGRRTIFSSRII